MNSPISTSFTKDLFALASIISLDKRKDIYFLFGLTLVSIFFEILSLAVIVNFLSLVTGPSQSELPDYISYILHALAIDTNNKLSIASLILCFVVISSAAIKIYLTKFLYETTYLIGADLANSLYESTLNKPYSWHLTHNTSETTSAIYKLDVVTFSIIVQTLQGTIAFLVSIAILGMLFVVDYKIALISGFFFVALYTLTSYFTTSRIRSNSRAIATNETDRIQTMQEGLGGIRDVLLDNAHRLYLNHFSSYNYNMAKAKSVNSYIAAAPRFILESSSIALIGIVTLLLADQSGGAAAAIPTLGALLVGAQKLVPQMQQVYSAWTNINGSRHQLSDVIRLLRSKSLKDNNITNIYNNHHYSTVNEQPKYYDYAYNNNLIRFANIGFRYDNTSNYILRNLNINIAKGSCIGIVGKTGSGKSTFVDLVMGLLSPSEGGIYIDGKLLMHETARDWHQKLAHVPQMIFLTDSTLAENIAFNVPRELIDINRVKAAATKALIASHIENLPDGYNTYVGERGVRLSGGQRQRIGLARAFYKNHDVLILDEATSALDEQTESNIMRNIHADNKTTTIIISHRISTLSACDAILRFELGNGVRWLQYKDLIFDKSTTT